jgi:large subunit ribosomal protein LP0
MPAAGKDKSAYFDKFIGLCAQYSTIVLVTVDNIGSSQMARIRRDLRGKATLLMGKNTMMRRAIRDNEEKYPELTNLTPWIVGNVGLVFVHGDVAPVKQIIIASRVPAAAKAGIVAPVDVFIEPQQTALPPTKTSFLQALNIASKINKGTVEITGRVHLIKKGEKVGPSEATMLQMLEVLPFDYGLIMIQVYEKGRLYPPEVLDISNDDVLKQFSAGVSTVAAISLATGFSTIPAVPHVVLNAYKNLLAIAVATSYSFPQAQKIKDLLADPAALARLAAAASSAASAPATGGGGKAAAKEAPKKEEKKEEKPESEDMGFDLFG